MIFEAIKQYTAVLLFIIFVTTPVFLAGPKNVNAQFGGASSFAGGAALAVPTSDVVLGPKEAGISVFGVTLPISLDGLAYMAANVVIAQITDSIVTWIDSGFQGSPAFIEDPGAWFLETADMVSGAFIEELGAEDLLCDPFAPIRITLSYNYNRSFPRDYRCKLSDVIENVENFAKFTAGDFTGQGGWQSWFNITQNRQNNPYGVYFGAQIELDRRIANAIGRESDTLNQGKGFLSMRRCKVWDTANGQEPGPNNPTSGTLQHDCKEYGPIETPGSIVEDQLNRALGSELNRIEVADEINEILSALVNQLVKTVFTAGLSNVSHGNIFDPGSVNADFEVSCSYSPNEPLFLDPPTVTQTEQVKWKVSVLGGAGETTYRWSFTGDPIPVATPFILTNATVTPVVYSSAGVKTTKVEVEKETEFGKIKKTANCSLTVLPNPPLEVTSCNVVPPSIRREQQPDEMAMWTLKASGGVSIPNPNIPFNMGFCIFTGQSDDGPFGISVPLTGTTLESSCSLTTGAEFFDRSGEHYVNVLVSSGEQSVTRQGCGPLIILDP